MQAILAVAAGGAIGSVVRYLIVKGGYLLIGAAFPVVTLAINALGSFLIGCAAGFFAGFEPVPAAVKAFWMAGVLGGFTTFSAYSLETVEMYQRGDVVFAALYAFLSVILCVAATMAGLYLFRSASL